MAQNVYPTGDVTNQWASGGYADIDEGAIPNDGDFAYSADKPALDVFEFHLDDPTDPVVHTGHTVRYRWATVDGGVLSGSGSAVTQTYNLYQGTTLISTGTGNTHSTNSATFSAASFTISEAEAGNITEYSDLRVRIVASGGAGSPANRRGAAISWAELEVPDAPSTDRQAVVTAFELETTNAGRQAEVSAFELETTNAGRQAEVSAFELETEVAGRTAEVTAFELEVPTAPRQAIVTAFELETPDFERRAEISAFELETENAARQAEVTAFELETADAPRQALVTAFELETEVAARQALVTAMELEVPAGADPDRQAVVTAFELETEDAARTAEVTAFELEVPTAPRQALVTAFEFETGDSGHRTAVVSAFELQTTDAGRQALVTAMELEVPTAPRQAIVTAFELEAPALDRQAVVTAFELETGDAPSPNRQAVVTAFELETEDAARQAVITAFEFEAPPFERRAIVTAFEFSTPDTIWDILKDLEGDMSIKIISRMADTGGDGTGEYQAIGDYDGDPTLFKFTAQPHEHIVLSRLIGSFKASALTNADVYGTAAGSALTNGIQMYVTDIDGTIMYYITDPRHPVKANADWAHYCYDYNQWAGLGTGDDHGAWRWTFVKSGQPVELLPGWSLCVLLQDDFSSAVTEHHFIIQGYNIWPRLQGEYA